MFARRGLLVGTITLFIGFGINTFVGYLLPAIQSEYQQSGLFRPWSDPRMMLFFFSPFISGFALAYLWEKVHFEDKNSTKKAGKFAFFYFLIATVPGMFISYTSFQISFLMISLWTLSGFLNAFIAGYIFTKIKE